jgi:hypothetical protein
MKESLALSILKIEGTGEHSTCHIILNDNLQSTVLIHDKKISENCVEFPLSGVLKLLVTSSSKKSNLKYFLSLQISTLPTEGAIWLPLYSSFSEEALEAVPSVLPSTKVLVSINSLSSLTPVPEITETDSSVFDLEASLVKKPLDSSTMSSNIDNLVKSLMIVNEKNKELRVKNLELQEKFDLISLEFNSERVKGLQEEHQIVSQLVLQAEKYKKHCEILQTIHEDHIKQVNSVQILLKQEILQREHLEKQLTRITNEFKEYAKIAENRFLAFEKSIQLKDQEIDLIKQTSQVSLTLSSSLDASDHLRALQSQLHNTLEQLQESEFSRKVLQDKLETSSQNYPKDLEELLKAPKVTLSPNHSELLKELKIYRQKCLELENLLDDKYIQIKTQDNCSPQKEINDLKEMLKNEKVLNEMLLNQIREKNVKDLDLKQKAADEKFLEYLKVYQVEDFFSKIADGVFFYSGKKIAVAVKNGCLICKVGNAHIGIEKFMKSVLADKEERLGHKRSQTACFNEKKEDGKNLRNRLSLVCKENYEDGKGIKAATSRVFSTKSMTPNRESVFKRVSK